MIPRTNISNPFIHVNCPMETKELNCSRPYCPYWHTKPPITTSLKSSEKKVQNDQEKMPSTSKMSGKAEKNGLEKLPIWRRPDKCRNSLTNVEDNLFNQAHRKSRENLLDKLFGNDDNKAKTTETEKLKKKKEKPLWEVENGREKRRRSSSGSTKERKKAAKKAKEEEDETIRRERQALVDLLPDEGDDDEICVLDVVKSTENAGKNSSTSSSSAHQQQEITIVEEMKKSTKISSATISDPDSPLSISAATTNDNNAHVLHPPPSPAHSIHSTVSVVPETPICSPTKIGDEKKSGAISSMKNKTIPSAQEQLHKRTMEAMQKVVDEQQQKTKKEEDGKNSAPKYVEMEEWKPPTNKQQIPAKPKPIKKKFPTQLVIPTFSRNSASTSSAAASTSAIQMPVRVPSATKPLPTTKIPMKRELPATPTTTSIPLKREPPTTMPKTSTPKREPPAAMPKTSTPLKPEPLPAMPTTSTPIKRESVVSASTTTKLQPSLLQPKPLTVASSLKKGEQRKAHVPNFEILNTLKRQLIPLEPGNRKVSLQIRQARLAIIHAEYAKICWNQPDMAIESAQLEEKAILDKCSTRMGYLSAIPNVVKRLREAAAAAAAAKDNDNSDGKGRKDSISHKNVLLGRHSQSVTLGLNRAQRVAEHKATHLSESDFYEALAKEYLLSPEQLWTNGYPRWVEIESMTTITSMDEEEEGKEEGEEFEADEINPDTGYSIMERQKKQQRRKCVEIRQSELEISKGRAQKQFVPDSELKRICSRCGVEYFLTKEGNYKPGISSEDCIYHWGRAWKKRAHGVVDTRYTCCDSPISDRGCVVAGRHITQSLRMSTLAKYVETPRPFGVGDPRSKKVYALDCEMVYCVWGPEVARISMVDVLGELVLDEFVRPEHPLIDCNTKFSGLSADQINNARNNLKMAQERLFELVNSETILIGHSLESDLRALRIVHKRVVDTSVVFPHRLGPPQKRALKTLATEILQLIIQEDESGHDSKEDALVCMRIMLKKVRGGGGGTE